MNAVKWNKIAVQPMYTSLIMHYHFILSCVWVNKSFATLKSESASEYIAWYIVDTLQTSTSEQQQKNYRQHVLAKLNRFRLHAYKYKMQMRNKVVKMESDLKVCGRILPRYVNCLNVNVACAHVAYQFIITSVRWRQWINSLWIVKYIGCWMKVYGIGMFKSCVLCTNMHTHALKSLSNTIYSS